MLMMQFGFTNATNYDLAMCKTKVQAIQWSKNGTILSLICVGGFLYSDWLQDIGPFCTKHLEN